ncbi:MAG: tetratricopeptide repeat protein [Propionibacteriaceae bacterium]|jgi:putative thioredoxin|nr:tetratricopeptide repeat protein [Propionibacteriaceae bacterium]
MTEPASTHGAIDLTDLNKPAAARPSGAYVVELDEANFEATLRQSARFPIVIEFYSPRDPGGKALSQALNELAAAANGAWLLARLNVDAAGQVAQALQIHAVPTVVGVLGGRMVPLWQGTLSKDEAGRYIQELLKVAAANGLLGKAEPQSAASAADDALDPRYEAAHAAMAKSDFASALAEFEKLLADNPNDVQARVGKAQAGLLARVGEPAPAAVDAARRAADQAPADVAAALLAADFEVAHGLVEQGFARLVAAVAATAGAERDQARTRLLELFDTLEPTDPVVLTARRNLATALY